MKIISAHWAEGGSAMVYGRLMAQDATGESIASEGKALKKADISSITYKVFDISTKAVTTSGTVDKTVCIFDTLQTSSDDSVWTFTKGFNFRHELEPDSFPAGNRAYQVEYRITETGGTVGWAVYKGMAQKLLTPDEEE